MSVYWSSVVRAAYAAQDRPDLGHAFKTLARKMISPTEASLTNLKRLGRYLKKYPDFARVLPQQSQARPKCVKVQLTNGSELFLKVADSTSMSLARLRSTVW